MDSKANTEFGYTPLTKVKLYSITFGIIDPNDNAS